MYKHNAFDIETFTEDEKMVPYCVCYIAGDRKKTFFYEEGKNIIDEFLDSLFSDFIESKTKKNTMYIYAHNLNFDGIFLLEYLTIQKKYIFQSFIIKLNLYNITVAQGDKKIIFKCSYKLLPLSLKNIAIGFGLKIKKQPFPHKFALKKNLNYIGETPNVTYFDSKEDYEYYRNKIFDFKKISITYCMNDVHVTVECLDILQDVSSKNNINIDKYNSAPSISINLFLKQFNEKKITLKHTFLFDQIVRPSYHGGRTEVYGNPVNGEYIYHFDFSGMYAQVMKEKFCHGSYQFSNTTKEINKPGFYWIEYESNTEYPVLPHKRIHDGKLMFTNGVNSGIFWFEEILLFMEYGGKIRKIMTSLTFEKYDYIFTEFSDYCTKIREMGGAYKFFGKLMINSLYGRLGMNYTDTTSFFIHKEELSYYTSHLDILKYIEIGDHVLIEIEHNYKCKQFKIINKSIKHKSNLACASAITSKARIKLYRAQQSVIRNGGRLFYSDTDSIFAGYERNVDNETHGDIYWDIKKKDTKIRDGVYVTSKVHSSIFEDGQESTKFKGYNQKNLKFEDIKNKFYSGENAELSDYMYIDKSDLQIKQKISIKEFRLDTYDKRKFSIDKKNTQPYLYINNIYV